MKEKRYTILKGRGISFIDEKKVKVKGSEVNYSLQTIERILEKQKVLSNSQSVRKDESCYSNINHHQQLKKEHRREHDFLSDNFIKEASKMIEQMTKPEQTNDHINNELLKRKRKKKRQYHHL
jgi:hypothetical protein